MYFTYIKRFTPPSCEGGVFDDVPLGGHLENGPTSSDLLGGEVADTARGLVDGLDRAALQFDATSGGGLLTQRDRVAAIGFGLDLGEQVGIGAFDDLRLRHLGQREDLATVLAGPGAGAELDLRKIDDHVADRSLGDDARLDDAVLHEVQDMDLADEVVPAHAGGDLHGIVVAGLGEQVLNVPDHVIPFPELS